MNIVTIFRGVHLAGDESFAAFRIPTWGSLEHLKINFFKDGPPFRDILVKKY